MLLPVKAHRPLPQRNAIFQKEPVHFHAERILFLRFIWRADITGIPESTVNGQDPPQAPAGLDVVPGIYADSSIQRGDSSFFLRDTAFEKLPRTPIVGVELGWFPCLPMQVNAGY